MGLSIVPLGAKPRVAGWPNAGDPRSRAGEPNRHGIRPTLGWVKLLGFTPISVALCLPWLSN